MVTLIAHLGCENVGLDPSGKLACSSPQKLCPQGLSCIAGRCWKNGTYDASSAEPSSEEVRAEGPTPDGPRVSDDAGSDVATVDDGSDQANAADILAEASSPEVTASDAKDAAPSQDVASPDVNVEAGPTCGVCPSPPSNGHSTCTGATCGIACDSTYKNCRGTQTCIPSTTCCGDTDCPKNMPACISGQCKARANNDACSSDTECGSGHCAATAPGAATKVCCDSDCSGSCNDGCAGGMCQHKKFRTTCGEIDNSPYTPRYFTCDGNGNCNPPSFPCNGVAGSICAANANVACCGDPNNGYALTCVTPATCASQSSGDFEMSCGAAIDCPAGSFCCSEENLQDVFVTGCATNCQLFSTHGRDPGGFTHNQLCDPLRDSSCPVGKQCKVDQVTGLGMCGL